MITFITVAILAYFFILLYVPTIKTVSRRFKNAAPALNLVPYGKKHLRLFAVAVCNFFINLGMLLFVIVAQVGLIVAAIVLYIWVVIKDTHQDHKS